MIGLFGSWRGRLMAGLALVVALLATWPLRSAADLFGLDQMGVSARSLRGPVWWGGAEELNVAGIRLGTVDMYLSPLDLLLARARVGISRQYGKVDDIRGAALMGIGMRGVDGVTGNLPLAAKLAPLPISRFEFQDFGARFSGGFCIGAKGQVRAQVLPLAGGMALANGLTGTPRCSGDVLLLPLVSQSGHERLDLRIMANGRFEASMRIATENAGLMATLAAAGFRPAGGEQILRLDGQL